MAWVPAAAPRTPRIDPRGESKILLLTLAGLAVAVTAGAIDNVSNEDWVYDPAIAPAPQTSTVRVVFDATVTADDIFQGLRFATAGDGAVTLLDYHHMGLPNLPDAGAPISVAVVFSLSCEADGSLVRATPVEASVRFCTPDRGLQWSPLPGAGTGHAVRVTGPFDLTVLDERRAPGPNPAPALHCGGGAKSLPAQHRPRLIWDGGANGTIGVYFDRNATMCQGTIQPGAADTVYVLGVLGEATRCGIAGAEFRFSGVPASWGVFPVPNPALLVIGDPFGDGVTLASACQKPTNGAVVLYTVLVLATALETDVEFAIGNRRPPTNPLFPCPLLIQCDVPAFTKVCVEAQSCFVNPTVPRKCPAAALPVEQATWTVIKQIYR